MILRTDHVAGGVAIAAGLLVWAISGDLPVGRLAAPTEHTVRNRIAQIVIPDSNVNDIANGNNGSTDGFTNVGPWANFSF